MSSEQTGMVPVAENLFTFADGDVALIGSRCRGCEEHFFPQRASCSNPDCRGGGLAPARFGRSGRLYSWTVQAYQPPALFGMSPWSPYALGLVELPEGLRVMAMLTETDGLRCDMEMTLVAEPLYTDAKGREVLTYKYRPHSA